MKKSLFVTFFICLLSISAFAQNPSPTATPNTSDENVLKISTTLIQVDVTVTDKKGRIVADLKPEDFEVYENGQKQEITNFSFISVDPKNKSSENFDSPLVSKSKKSIPIPPVKLKAEQVRRTYALVVDDLGLSFESISLVKQSLKKFVNEQMQQGDLVAIIRTGSGIGALQSFTSDKRQLLAAIEKIRWNAYGRSGISVFDPINTSLKEDLSGTKKSDGSSSSVSGMNEDKAFEKQVNEIRKDNFSVGTLGSLNYVIRGMSELPGRKAVMLFSEGFVLTSESAPNRILETMKVLADLANRSSVVFYTLDPRGLQVPGMANANDNIREVIPDNFDPATYSDGRNERETDFRDTQQSLRYLAYETGGVPFVNQNNISLGLQRAIDDQGNYYLLGYQPDQETFDPKKSKFNKLEVKLKRPELKIRYRSGFFGITDEKLQAIAPTPQQKLMNALTSPFGATGINLSLYPIYQNDAINGDFIQALVHIDAKDLKFTEVAGKYKTNFDLIVMTFGDNGVTIDQLSKNYTIEVGEKSYQNMLINGFVYNLPVPIKKSGAYQFRIALRDTNSGNIGSASQFIEVPNLKKKLSISNLVLDDFTPEEWQKSAFGENRDSSERSALLDTTVRRFKGGTVLRYDFIVYTPKQTQSLTIQIRLIRDGKVIYEEPPSPVKIAGQTDLLRVSSAGAVSLGKNLQIGDYVLQVIVTDGTNEKKFATQFVEFEIIG